MDDALDGKLQVRVDLHAAALPARAIRRRH